MKILSILFLAVWGQPPLLASQMTPGGVGAAAAASFGLAQFAPVSNEAFGGWLITAAAVLIIIDRVVGMIRGGKPHPPYEERFAGKAETHASLQKMDERLSKVEDGHREDITGLWEKLNTTAETLQRLVGRMEVHDRKQGPAK